MDLEKLSKQYMDSYNSLVEKYQTSDIQTVVSSINKAIRSREKEKINACYDEILKWNSSIEDLDKKRASLNSKFHLRLPSVSMYKIVYDELERAWVFRD